MSLAEFIDLQNLPGIQVDDLQAATPQPLRGGLSLFRGR